MYSKVLGNNKPNASKTPKTAPEAPTVGIFMSKLSLDIELLI